MEQQKKHDIALMKYFAIAPVISGLPAQYRSFSEYFRQVSERGILHPDGGLRHYAVSTIAKWYELYAKNGFDALQPAGRCDEGKPGKLDDALQEQIIYLKEHYPRMSAAAIYKQLQHNGSIRRGELSESTVLRFINRLAFEKKLTNNQDMRRYERPHINEVWCGDSSVGPYLKTPDGKKHRVYVIALIDDASRMVVGTNVFFGDTFVNLMSVLKSAVSKYGVPRVLNFDNSSAYISEKLKGAGGTPDIFEENAVEAVLNAADGTPRMINKLCSASLLVASSQGFNSINADAVMRAVSDCELG